MECSILVLQLIFDIAIAICKCKELVFNSNVLFQKKPTLIKKQGWEKLQN